MSESRHLAAVVFIDIVNFTSMMGESEEKAKSAIKSFKMEAPPIVEEHEGVWHKDLGDGALCSFASAKNAILASIKIQQCDWNEFKLRIGIHLGDITYEDGDIFGDGVNIASRIQSEAIPGGISVSSSLQEFLKNQSEFDFQSIGNRKLKNVNKPVQVYQVLAEGIDSIQEKNIIKRLLKTAIIYVVGGWVLIQILKVVFPMIDLTIHQLNWTQFMILTGLPVAILLVWAHRKDFAKRANRQVVAYSSSLLIVILSVVIGLNTLGGSMTYNVEIEDASGNKETISVLKVVPSIRLFSFENLTDSADTDWIGDGIVNGVWLDLGQFNLTTEHSQHQHDG